MTESLYQLKISSETLRMSAGVFWFLMICLLGGISFVILKMLIPSLMTRPIPILALIVPVGIIFFCGFLGIIFFKQFSNNRPMHITLYKNGVQFEDSKDLVPYSEIQISRGQMEGLNSSEGVIASAPLGQALEFKIKNFDRYFEINLWKQLSPQYSDSGTYKVPIGNKGLTESQLSDFLEAYNRISQSE